MKTTSALQSPALAQPNAVAAVVLMCVATAFIAGTTLAAKALGTDTLGPALPPFQITFGRFLFAFVAIGGAAIVLRLRFSRVHPGLHLGRTALGAIGVTLMFAAVAHIPLSDATAISFLNPVFGMMLAIPFLGERVGRWRWLAAAIALCGAMVLLRPGPETFRPAALLALGAAMALGTELIFIKLLSRREAPLQILLINNAIGVALVALVALPGWQAPTGAQWAGLVTVGVMMASAQACFINAMARADASFVTPFSYLTLIFAALYDLVIFDVVPDAVSILGAAIILAGAGLLAWREAVNRRIRA